jgi:outer membrane protein assembly factor BamB
MDNRHTVPLRRAARSRIRPTAPMIGVVLGALAGCGDPASVAPPTLQIVSPRQYDSVLAGQTVTLQVTVDGLRSSDDVALEWVTEWGRVVGRGESTLARLADAGTYAVAVVARRGVDVLATDRVTVTVLPNESPVVAIDPIGRPCLVYVTDTVRLVAHATDPESAAQVEWFSDLRGPLGTGDTLRWVPGTGAEGQHVISARALDPEGNLDVALAVLRVLGGPRFGWAREYPTVARVGACGGSRGRGVMLPLALADDGTLVAGMGTPGMLNAVWSLTADGDVRWAFPTDIDPAEHWAGLSVAADGTVFFANYDGVVHAIRPDGTVAWSAGVLRNDWHGRFALAPDGALFVTGKAPDSARYHDLVRIDPATGAERWRLRRARDGNMSSVAVLPDGNLMQSYGRWALRVTPAGAIARIDSTGVEFTYSNYGMSAFDTAGVGYHPVQPALIALRPDHTVRWYVWVGVAEPVLGVDGAVYATSADTVWRVSPGGQVQWSAPHPGGSRYNGRLALLADGTLWVAAGRFLLHFEAATGVLIDQVELADWVTSAPAVAEDGTLYVMTGANRIVAIDGGAPLDPQAPWPTWRRDNRRTSSVPRP